MTKEMNEDFFDWLNKCPVQWLLLNTDEDSRDYSFIIPSEEINYCSDCGSEMDCDYCKDCSLKKEVKI